MHGTHRLVIAAGLGAIAWVNWYFLPAERATAVVLATSDGTPHAGTTAAPGAGPVPQVTVAVKGGYGLVAEP